MKRLRFPLVPYRQFHIDVSLNPNDARTTLSKAVRPANPIGGAWQSLLEGQVTSDGFLVRIPKPDGLRTHLILNGKILSLENGSRIDIEEKADPFTTLVSWLGCAVAVMMLVLSIFSNTDDSTGIKYSSLFLVLSYFLPWIIFALESDTLEHLINTVFDGYKIQREQNQNAKS